MIHLCASSVVIQIEGLDGTSPLQIILSSSPDGIRGWRWAGRADEEGAPSLHDLLDKSSPSLRKYQRLELDSLFSLLPPELNTINFPDVPITICPFFATGQNKCLPGLTCTLESLLSSAVFSPSLDGDRDVAFCAST